ncbi:MAG: hypothetical protein IJ391_00125 [Clostridia bacterium]|nr:hypothetical protein [Clostridia bacterium]
MKTNMIIYGERQNGIQKKAVETLTEFLLDYTLKYPICTRYGDDTVSDTYRRFYIGTRQNNSYINKHSQTVLSYPEEYAVSVSDDTVIIEGYDDAGVLYGCIDFFDKYIVKQEYTHDDRYLINPFDDKLPDTCFSSHPDIKERGIWTWGHVIYDFRAFIDNMVKCKLNTLIVWNDRVPENAAEMAEYAHSCNVKIIWGFSWLWGVDCSKVDIGNAKSHSYEILQKYEKEYSVLGGDGIYFQSFTELKEDTVNGHIIAEAVTDFVNHTAAMFYEKYPTLELLFGLHASSVKNKLSYLKQVDPRIRIVWEDAGAFPFSYFPADTASFDQTMALTRELALLRAESERFGAVTKGFTKLDWSSFEHTDGSIHVGVSSKRMKEDRVLKKRTIWRYIQAYWLVNADKAYEAVRLMCALTGGDALITALVEDGMLEESIMYPVALYSQMMWDTRGDIKEMMSEVALRRYIEFA